MEAALLADAFHTEGVYRLERGDFDLAVQRLARAVEASPRNPVYRGNYGWALFKTGDATGAAAEIEESIRLAGDRPIPYANLAEVRLVQGDTAAALAAYSRFIQLNDDAALDADAERRIREIRRR
ncbi:MAG: tetratricopeptide repeat protein [Longimicrobiales bacterium]